eukprot:12506193-Alexandrium_andersonii.AAC.1
MDAQRPHTFSERRCPVHEAPEVVLKVRKLPEVVFQVKSDSISEGPRGRAHPRPRGAPCRPELGRLGAGPASRRRGPAPE